MSGRSDGATRRGFLRGAGLAAIAGSAAGITGVPPAAAKPAETAPTAAATGAPMTGVPITAEVKGEPFWGRNQGGIVTPVQGHTYFAAFDLTTAKREEVIKLLQAWTAAAARLAAGQLVEPFSKMEIAYNYDTSTTTTTATTSDEPEPAPVTLDDTADAHGLPPARLTITFGFGAGLFEKDGEDRYGLKTRCPEALVELPHFVGDQLVPERSDGDLSVQACADDAQVAFHAVRQLARLAEDVAQVRWAQTGFMPNFGSGQTPRNLMGFRDGTNNPPATDAAAMDKVVWVGDEGPDWMQGGSYVVIRRIRMALEHWDRSKIGFQEQTFGRHKMSGAPIGRTDEREPLDLDAADKDGNYVIAENAHVRLAAAATNDGAQILRRPYSYNDGVNFTAERWPPWRQGLEYDAGLFFVCYQRDPRTGFVKMFEKMAKFDMLNQFVTHVGAGLYACPGGAVPGEFIGQRLFEAA